MFLGMERGAFGDVSGRGSGVLSQRCLRRQNGNILEISPSERERSVFGNMSLGDGAEWFFWRCLQETERKHVSETRSGVPLKISSGDRAETSHKYLREIDRAECVQVCLQWTERKHFSDISEIDGAECLLQHLWEMERSAFSEHVSRRWNGNISENLPRETERSAFEYVSGGRNGNISATSPK